MAVAANSVSLDARALPAPRLEIRARDGAVTQFPLVGKRYVIGRLPDVDIRIPHDTVSRRHAELVQDPFGRWWLRDLGSRYGMRVRNAPVAEVLLDGTEEVQVGEFFLRLGSGTRSIERSDLSLPPSMLRDDRSAGLHTLGDVRESPISPGQLADLTRLGHELSHAADGERRQQMLCDHFLGPAYQALSAMVLRLPGGKPEAPQRLYATQTPQSDPSAGYVSRTLLREVAKLREPVLADNLPGSSARLDLSLPAAQLALAALACPLNAAGESLDVLYLTLPPQFGTTSFLALAALAAALFQQADTGWRLHANTQAYELIERDLQRGHEIQQRLLPKPGFLPGLDVAFGMRPCRWVGGDYVDVIPLADGRVLLALGDVSGKGLSAALTTGNLHALIHARATAGGDVAAIVAGANDYLSQVLPDDAFVTLCCMLIDATSGELTLVNAGHPAPLIVAADGVVRELEISIDLPLSLQVGAVKAQTARLEPDQTLVVYSDGATDLVNEQNQRLDLPGLLEAIQTVGRNSAVHRSQEFVAALEQRLDAFQGRSLPADDRTLLVVKRNAG